MTKNIAAIISRLYKTRGDYWNIHPESANIISDLIIANKPKKILEIGTSNGLSSIIMGSLAAKYGGTVTTVEYYEERVDLARQNIREAELENTITVIQGDAITIIPDVTEIWDFVFIDAGKQDYIVFYQLLKDKLAQDAILVADNTVSHREQLSDFIEAISHDDSFKVQEQNVGEGLLIAKYQG